LFYLTIAEIRVFAAREARPWRELISGRRGAYDRELRRRQIPRLLLSDGRAFYEGIAEQTGDSEDRITGSPVSPGVAEGIVHVVLDPRQANLRPGEILVCPGTDPSWTPLFLSAGALVMEVGGLMTHGSVVAREYGIPGVVGVHAATTRLKTGQRVRVDGSRGVVEVVDQQ
jgi:phosphoenolpyruvate synthase/pyruvate phosphate dikinase